MTTTAVSEIHESRAAPARLEDMKSFLARVSSPAGFEEQQQLAIAYDKAVLSLIGANDVQVDGDRTFKKKSAWRKLGRHFSISTFVVSSKIDYVADPDEESDRELILVATVIVRGVAIWGQSSEAIGVCATDEESGQRVITIADALATAETRATNRAVSNLIAMGEVSAEEIQRSGDGSARSNGPPQRKERPAEEIKMPFGPSKGTLLGDMESGDLAGALRWAEDRSEEKGQIQFADFQKAAKQVIENRKKASATQLHPDDPRRQAAPDPAAAQGGEASTQKPAEPELTLEEALASPFPFNRGESNHLKAMGGFGSDHLRDVKKWIHEKQAEKGDEEWHRKTARAIELILAEREKGQTKLELETPAPAPAAAKGDSLPAGGSQEPQTPAPATGGGPKRSRPGKVSDAIEPDPTSRVAYNARIKKALQSPAITPELRPQYATDNLNGFKKEKGAKSIEWWVEKLESIAKADPESFPSALEDSDDDLPF